MKTRLLENKDFLSGLLMIVVGGIAFYMALNYPFGTSLRMGPGYFPRVLAGLLIAFGVWIGLRGLRTGEKVAGVWGIKPLALITVSLVAFGWLMERVGFVPSLIVLLSVSALAGPDFRWKEVAVLTAVMIVFAYGVFVKALGMPFRLFWWS